MTPICCLKIDVDTHDGMRDGVPRLLDAFRAAGVRATFLLAFGPDNAGKAIWQVFRSRGFLKKMIATGAPKLYGWRTILSGTLLPARPIATKFPDIVRRIEAEGHEVAVHCWDHRLWQDHLPRLDRAAVADQFRRAFDAFEAILRRRPRAVGAPAWTATRTSLEVQDTLALTYASDMRGGMPCYPELDGYRSTTLQVPTTGPCLEELLTLGERDESAQVEAALAEPAHEGARVIPLHAEVEGGPFGSFLGELLSRIGESGWTVRTLEEHALACLASTPPVVPVKPQPLAGRAGLVLAPAPAD